MDGDVYHPCLVLITLCVYERVASTSNVLFCVCVCSARQVFEKAVKYPFKGVDDLATVWCEWAEMEVRNEEYERALRLLQQATNLPNERVGITFHFFVKLRANVFERYAFASRAYRTLIINVSTVRVDEMCATRVRTRAQTLPTADRERMVVLDKTSIHGQTSRSHDLLYISNPVLLVLTACPRLCRLFCRCFLHGECPMK